MILIINLYFFNFPWIKSNLIYSSLSLLCERTLPNANSNTFLSCYNIVDGGTGYVISVKLWISNSWTKLIVKYSWSFNVVDFYQRYFSGIALNLRLLKFPPCWNELIISDVVLGKIKPFPRYLLSIRTLSRLSHCLSSRFYKEALVAKYEDES